MLFGFSLLFFMPVVLLFPDTFDITKQQNDVDPANNHVVELLNQGIFLAATITSVFVMVRAIEDKSLADVKLVFNFRQLLAGFFGGVIIFTVLAGILSISGIVCFTFIGFSSALPIGMLLHMLVAASEEILVRGYLLNTLQERLSAGWAILITSVFFGCLHLANDHISWIGAINISLSGVLMGILAARSYSIWSALGLHWAWNFIQGPVMGFNVSGHLEKGVFSIDSSGPVLFSGGEFGGEGSILLIPITIIACWLATRLIKITATSNDLKNLR